MQLDDLNYYMANLMMLDPDQLVSDLNLSSEDIICAFPSEVRKFLEKEFG